METAGEFRIALTVDDYAKSLSFYRDVLGLSLIHEWPSEEGHGAILSLTNATLEILDKAHSAWVDRMEAGRRVSGQVRLAVQFQDLAAAIDAASAAGARLVRGPVETPWKDLNARLAGPDGIQMTFFKKPG
jgi:lactoylglutathione lyase